MFDHYYYNHCVGNFLIIMMLVVVISNDLVVTLDYQYYHQHYYCSFSLVIHFCFFSWPLTTVCRLFFCVVCPGTDYAALIRLLSMITQAQAAGQHGWKSMMRGSGHLILEEKMAVSCLR